MSDDLKMGIDITADLSKLDTSLQRAEQKVSASGQRMQKAATFNPSIGGINATGSAGGMQSAPHPNAVSFASLNSNVGGGGFRPAIGSGGAFTGGVGALMNAAYPNAVTFGNLNAQAGWGATAGGKGIGGWLNGSAAFLQKNLMAGVATAAATLGVVSATEVGVDMWRDMDLTKHADNPRNRLHGMAKVEQDIGNIPLVGGLLQTLLRNSTGVSWTASNKMYEENVALGRRLNMGAFGGGLRGRQTDINAEQRLLGDDAMNNRMNQIFDPVGNENYRIKKGLLDLKQTELNIETEQRSKNIETQISGAKLQSMGMGKYANLMSINRNYDEQIAMHPNEQGYQDQLKRLKSAELSAALMSGLQPAQDISMSSVGGALAQGSVRMGSLSGQSAEYLKQIAQNTGVDAPAVIGR